MPLYERLADVVDRIADENTDAPQSVARARSIAEFLRFLAARLPQLVTSGRPSVPRMRLRHDSRLAPAM